MEEWEKREGCEMEGGDVGMSYTICHKILGVRRHGGGDRETERDG